MRNETLEPKLCANDLAGLQALGADVGLADMAVVVNRDFLHIGAERAIGYLMRMADATTGNRSLTANFANLRHLYQLRFLEALLVQPWYYTTAKARCTRFFILFWSGFALRQLVLLLLKSLRYNFMVILNVRQRV